jgi:hypothetical protein
MSDPNIPCIGDDPNQLLPPSESGKEVALKRRIEQFNNPHHKGGGLLKQPKAASMRLVEKQPFQDGL